MGTLREVLAGFAILASAGTAVGDADTDLATLLSRAVTEYETAMTEAGRDVRLERFGAAEQLFRQAIEATPDSRVPASSYVNLGNAALQAEHVGPAILAFRRALEREPSNAQARQNLEFARSLIPAPFRRESNREMVNTFFFWRQFFSRREIYGLAALFFLAAAASFAGGLVTRNVLLRSLAFVAAICWALCLVSNWVVADARASHEAVVVGDDVLLRSADSENAAPRFSQRLPNGSEVRVLRRRERWTEVEISGGRSGWLRASEVEAI